MSDKYTQQPRGFGFAHFDSVADAARVLHTFNVRACLLPAEGGLRRHICTTAPTGWTAHATSGDGADGTFHLDLMCRKRATAQDHPSLGVQS